MKKRNKAKLSYILLLASILGGTTACKVGTSSSSQGSESGKSEQNSVSTTDKVTLGDDVYEIKAPTNGTISVDNDGTHRIKVASTVSSLDVSTLITVDEGLTVKYTKDSTGNVTTSSKLTLKTGENIVYLVISKEGAENLIVRIAVEKTASYTITFDLDGGEGTIENQTVEAGGKATKPSTDPTKTGYNFLGWVDSEGKTFDFNKGITSSVTVKASWEQQKVNYTVKFYIFNGTAYVEDTTKSITRKDGAGSEVFVSDEDKVLQGYALDEDDSVLSTTLKGDGSSVLELKFRKETTYKINVYLDGVLSTELSETVVGLEGKEVTLTPEAVENYHLDSQNSVLTQTINGDGTTVIEARYIKNMVSNKITVNDIEIDMSSYLKVNENSEEPTEGYYNYDVKTSTITNLMKMGDALNGGKGKVLYLNNIQESSFSFETTIDMSSLDDSPNSSHGRQGIVLTTGTATLGIMPAKWTSGNSQDNTIEAGTGEWYLSTGSEHDIVADIGKHDGVGKCVTTNYDSTCVLKVEVVKGSHINLYMNGKLISVLKADGLYAAGSTTASTKTQFNDEVAEILNAEKEVALGFTHIDTCDIPGVVYSNITVDDLSYSLSKTSDKVVNATTTYDLSSLITTYNDVTYTIEGVTDASAVNLNEGENEFVVNFSNGESKTISIYRNKMFTVQFTGSDGQVITSLTKQVEEGNTVIAPEMEEIFTETHAFDGWDYDFNTPITENITIKSNWVVKIDATYEVEVYIDGVKNEELSSTIDSFVGADITYKAEEKQGYYLTSESVLSGTITENSELILQAYYVSSLVNNKISVNGTEIDMSKYVKYHEDETVSAGYYSYDVNNKVITNNMTAGAAINVSGRKVLYLNDIRTDSFHYSVDMDLSGLESLADGKEAANRQGIALTNGTEQFGIMTYGRNWYFYSSTKEGGTVISIGLTPGLGKAGSYDFSNTGTLSIDVIKGEKINVYLDGTLYIVLDENGIHDASMSETKSADFGVSIKTILDSNELAVGLTHFDTVSANTVYNNIKIEELGYSLTKTSDRVANATSTYDLSTLITTYNDVTYTIEGVEEGTVVNLNEGNNEFVVNFSNGESETISIYRNKMFIVQFTGQDGQVIETLTTSVEEGTLPEAPEMEDTETHVFIGWDYDFTSTVVTDNVTIASKWEAKVESSYTVEYYFDNVKNEEMTLTETKYVGEHIEVAVEEIQGYYTSQTSVTGEVDEDGLVLRVDYVSSLFNSKVTVNDVTIENTDLVLGKDITAVAGKGTYDVTTKTLTNTPRYGVFGSTIMEDSFRYSIDVDLSEVTSKDNIYDIGIGLTDGTNYMSICAGSVTRIRLGREGNDTWNASAEHCFSATTTAATLSIEVDRENNEIRYYFDGTLVAYLNSTGTYRKKTTGGIVEYVNVASASTEEYIAVINGLLSSEELIGSITNAYNSTNGSVVTNIAYEKLSYKVTSEAKVSNSVATYDLDSLITTYNGVTYEVYEGETKVEDPTSFGLSEGNNVLTVKFSNGETETITIYKNYVYTVNFYENTETEEVYETQTIEEGTLIVPPELDDTVSHLFDGWVYADGSAYDFTKAPTESINLYPSWVEKLSSSYTVEYYFDNVKNEEMTLTETKYVGEHIEVAVEEIQGYYTSQTSVSGEVIEGGLVLRVDYVYSLFNSSVKVNGVDVTNNIVIGENAEVTSKTPTYDISNKTLTNIDKDGTYLSKVMAGSFAFSVKIDTTNATETDKYRVGLTLTDGTNFLSFGGDGTLRVRNYRSGNDPWHASVEAYLSNTRTSGIFKVEVDKEHGQINYYIDGELIVYFNENGTYVKKTTDGVVAYNQVANASTDAYKATIKALLESNEMITGVYNIFNTIGNTVTSEFAYEELTYSLSKTSDRVSNATSTYDVSTLITTYNDVTYTIEGVEEGTVVNLNEGNNEFVVNFSNGEKETISIYRNKMFTVQWLGEEGTLITTTSVEEGTLAIAPSDPTHSNSDYVFAGWDYDLTQTIDGDTDINAIWLENLASTSLTVNEATIDQSSYLMVNENSETPTSGYWNYDTKTQTVTNLMSAGNAINKGSSARLFYLDKVINSSFSFETTMDLSSMDSLTNSAYARQGIVISNGSTKLGIMSARWTSGNAQDNTIAVGASSWCFTDGTTTALVGDAGKHDGVGKCISTQLASTCVIKVEVIKGEKINLYFNGALITVMNSSGIHKGDMSATSTNTSFTSIISALLQSEELIVGFCHFDALNAPGVIYSNIKVEAISAQ